MEQRRGMERPHWLWQGYRAMGTIEVTLIIIRIFTPYYRVGIRCMA